MPIFRGVVNFQLHFFGGKRKILQMGGGQTNLNNFALIFFWAGERALDFRLYRAVYGGIFCCLKNGGLDSKSYLNFF